MLASSGIKATIEENHLSPDNNCRPDISIGRNGIKYIVDVMVTNPIAPSNIRNNSEAGQSAEAAARAKISKYERNGLLTNPAIKFIPFIVEAFGTINLQGLDMIKQVASYRSQIDAMHKDNLIRFWTRRIQTIVHTKIAEAIKIRSTGLTMSYVQHDYTTSSDFINSSEEPCNNQIY
jgi:hypothetical protein